MNDQLIRRLFDKDVEKIATNNELLELRKWKIIKDEFPEFIISMMHPKSGQKYAFKFICNDYPISMQIVEPATLELITDISRCPQGGSFLSDHTTTHVPFLCTPQLREYHTHTSHMSENWAFSPESRLPNVLESVYFHFTRTNS